MYSIDLQEFKLLHEAPRRLQELEEARGQLISVLEAEGQCVAAFAWGAISLPLELREELAGMVGQEIAIPKLGGKYHVRGLDV